jgi:hypothetical protein
VLKREPPGKFGLRPLLGCSAATRLKLNGHRCPRGADRKESWRIAANAAYLSIPATILQKLGRSHSCPRRHDKILGDGRGSAWCHRNRQEIAALQNVSIQRASELPQAVKSAIEQLLGRPIAPDEEISVAAVPPQRVPPSESRAAVARNLEAFLNRRADKVSGLPEEEIDAAIDEAVHAVRHNRT